MDNQNQATFPSREIEETRELLKGFITNHVNKLLEKMPEGYNVGFSCSIITKPGHVNETFMHIYPPEAVSKEAEVIGTFANGGFTGRKE